VQASFVEEDLVFFDKLKACAVISAGFVICWRELQRFHRIKTEGKRG